MDSECNLVHKYPVTVGYSQQVIQPCTEVVHDPQVKYLFRISGNLRIQVTGLDKVMSQDAFQTCLLRIYTLHTQGSQQTFTDQQPLYQCFEMQTLSRCGLLSWFSFALACQVIKLRIWQQDQKKDKPGLENGKFANSNEVTFYLSFPPLSFLTYIRIWFCN